MKNPIKSTEKNEVNSVGKVKVLELKKDVITKDVTVTLETNFRDEPITATISREDINNKGLGQLNKKGFPFMMKAYKDDFIKYFCENEDKFPLREVFSCVGRHEIDGKEYFLHKKAIIDGEETDMEYNGNMILASSGAFESDKGFFNETIIPLIGLQTICAVSLSAAIVGMIMEKDLRFILHIEGESTTGKTTSLMTAASIWGLPKITPDGIIRNWNTTDNKLVQSVNGNNGIMIGLDELSMAKMDYTQLTYLLTGGTDKQRMYEDNDNTGFRTIIISTGEIQFKDSNFGGIAARLFEIKGYNLTKDKETADKILAAIQNSYGNIGYEFAKAFSTYSHEDILKRIQSLTKKIIAMIEKYVKEKGKEYSPIYSRLAEKIAAIAVTAEIAKKKLGINFQPKKIAEFLISKTTMLECGIEQSDSAMEKFFEEYCKNSSKFPETNSDNIKNIWGHSVIKNGKLSEIIVLYNQFENIMKKVGFPNTVPLIKALKKKGFIICEEGKNYTRRKVGNQTKVKVIVIKANVAFGGIDYENQD